jgi:WD40 repeat protein
MTCTQKGIEQCQFVRGDMYLLDLHKTNGHVNGVTGGSYHPTDKTKVCTWSMDGTLRIWNVENPKRNLTADLVTCPLGAHEHLGAWSTEQDGTLCPSSLISLLASSPALVSPALNGNTNKLDARAGTCTRAYACHAKA